MTPRNTLTLGDEGLYAPLFISSRLMAAGKVGESTLHLLAVDRDSEGRVVYHHVVEDAGKVVDEGTDFHSGVLAPIDYTTAMLSLVSFLENDAEHYQHAHQMGTITTCDEYGDRCKWATLGEWAYQHTTELSELSFDLDPLQGE